ncbi:SRPBCC domain-containing protein [Pararhodobacter zhoushanensis]|uniref:SRPBCC domain-containing protein n=1 Tax=Pararhodobacter zhoushanensis TaxID=2479545 RepID=A0ABT3H211_9RHOB|nr:SRPBCC domain-containing protein [Pararhodobacter zhoushanensis]MCW1933884.1 SRPBCC domain-containing protein [Pararhodobacter zhoushanensis]
MTTNSITRSVHVPLSPEAAFDLFTTGFAHWWPREHCFCGEAALDRVFVDLNAGTWGEVTQAGETLLWGEILHAERPSHLSLSWQMDARISPWVPEPDPARASLIDLRIVPEGDGSTLSLTHHSFDRHGDGAEIMASVMVGMDRWADWLADFAAAAKR